MIPTEWSLHPELLEQVWRVVDKPWIDLFATRHNKKMSIYVSPIPDTEAYAVDALSLNWKGIHGYAYPPTPILNQVLRKIEREECIIVLVAPNWAKQSWFPYMLDLLIDWPIKLPTWKRMLKQPGSSIYHPNPEILDLHIWILSGEISRRKVF